MRTIVFEYSESPAGYCNTKQQKAMKNRIVKTVLPIKLVREFENFYETTKGAKMGRRLRDLIIEYARTDSAKEDDWANELLSDMYSYFRLLDLCEDEWASREFK